MGFFFGGKSPTMDSYVADQLLPVPAAYTQQAYADYAASLLTLGWTRTDLGACSDGVQHLYGMSLGNPANPCIFLTGCHHGLEWMNAQILKLFMGYLANPASAGAAGKYFARLIQTFRFFIIPVVNPYSYTNGTYGNANSVNLLCNYDSNWAAYDDTADIAATGCGKGSAPFSEVETQIVRDAILAQQPGLYIDCHNFAVAQGYEFLYQFETNDIFWTSGVYPRVQSALAGVTSLINPTATVQPWASQWARQQRAANNLLPLTCLIEMGGSTDSNQLKAQYGLNILLQALLQFYTHVQNGYPEFWQPSEAFAQDTVITAWSPTTNSGLSSVLNAGDFNNVTFAPQRSLLKFDLSPLPAGGTVKSAIWELYCKTERDPTDYNVGVHRALRQWYEGVQSGGVPPAGEDGSTWQKRNANGPLTWGANGGQAGIDYVAIATDLTLITGTGAWFAWDVTADVQACLDGADNFGWFVINPSELTANSGKQFHSSNGTAAFRPRMTVLMDGV